MSKKKLKIGVLGGYRGTSMISFLSQSDKAELVAICDNNEDVLLKQKERFGDKNISFYNDFEEFLKHDLDAVVLANFATEHAPFAIKCLNAGKHVFSECLPCQNMKEAVELVEAVERTGLIYCYGENYCYMAAPMEMKKLYRQGIIGEISYAEGHYEHFCGHIAADLTYGDKDHWRNNIYATFYCTHSLGPIIHITGLRPKTVVGFESPDINGCFRTGAKRPSYGVEMVTLENGANVMSIHGGLRRYNWNVGVGYTCHGDKGKLESMDEAKKIFIDVDPDVNVYGGPTKLWKQYEPEMSDDAKNYGHGGSDYVCVKNFIDRISGDKEADVIDVYEAMDMFLPGLFAYFSILKGNVPMQVPNMRNKEDRDKWRNDTTCTDKKVAGDMWVPPYSKGELNIPDEVYERQKQIYLSNVQNGGSDYTKMVFSQGEKRQK